MNDWSREFIAVDWGTSNRRAYLLDAEGQILAQTEDARGVATLERDEFPNEVGAIERSLGSHPMLLAGMVGSNRGWIEAPYVRCPATVGHLIGGLLPAEGGAKSIVPGLACVEGRRGDVMRGEEVQIFGLMALGGFPEHGTICHPGTHTKWVATSGECITAFGSVMTGEMFGLLRKHSVLAPLLQDEVQPGVAFFEGVDVGFSGAGLTAELFSVRARVLLSLMPEADALPFASGLLIGADVREGLAWSQAGEEIVVLGRPSLTRLYTAAIRQVGRRAKEMDGAQAFVAGMHAIRKKMA